MCPHPEITIQWIYRCCPSPTVNNSLCSKVFIRGRGPAPTREAQGGTSSSQIVSSFGVRVNKMKLINCFLIVLIFEKSWYLNRYVVL